MADIFISYKREDRQVAERLSIALESLGFEVWWDFGLLSGQRFRKVIEQVIDQCGAAVVLWSQLSRESEFVVDEATYAKAQDKLCPARIDECRLPMGFGQLHTDDLIGRDGELSHPGLQQLVAALEAKTGKKARLGAPRRDEATRERAAELEAFKAAQLAGSESALRAFVRQFPLGAFAGFVKSQLAVMAEAGAGAQTEAHEALQRERDARLAAEARASEAERRAQRPPPVAPPPPFAPPSEPAPKSAPPWKLIGAGAAALVLALVGIVSINGVQEEARRDREAAAQMEETRAAAEEPAWRIAEQADSIAGYEEYLRAFPEGEHVLYARGRRAELQAEQERLTREAQARGDEEAWARAQSDDSVVAYDAYVSAHPSGAHVREARRAVERLEREQADDAAFMQASRANTVAAYDRYLRDYASGRHASDARSARQRLQAAATPAPSTTAPSTGGAYSLALLHPDVRAAVEEARRYEQRANQAAERAREAARLARDAAARARAGEAGYRAETGSWGEPSLTARFETAYANGARNGYGMMTVTAGSPIGDVYAGQWRSGAYGGVGTYTYGDNSNSDQYGGLQYEGEYSNNRRSGVGVETWPSGAIFAGGYRDRHKSGPGVYRFADGRRYEGEYANSRRNGHGVFWNAQGRVVSQGIWSDDVLQTALAP